MRSLMAIETTGHNEETATTSRYTFWRPGKWTTRTVKPMAVKVKITPGKCYKTSARLLSCHIILEKCYLLKRISVILGNCWNFLRFRSFFRADSPLFLMSYFFIGIFSLLLFLFSFFFSNGFHGFQIVIVLNA